MKKNTINLTAKILDIVYIENGADLILYQEAEIDDIGRITERGEALRATIYTKPEVQAFRAYCEDQGYNKNSYLKFKLQIKFSCLVKENKYYSSNTLQVIEYE